MSETDASRPPEGYGAAPAPPATFEFLVLSLKTQAEIALGVFRFAAPEEGQDPEPDFLHARHTIDLLAMLQEKTRGNLSLEEQRLLENTLTELRFRYVASLEETKKRKSEKTSTAASASPEGSNS